MKQLYTTSLEAVRAGRPGDRGLAGSLGRGLCLVFVLALVQSAPAGASSHENAPAKEWDAAAVAKLLQRLAEQTNRLKIGVARHLEQATEGSTRKIVLDDVYEVHHRVISLQSGVRSGLGREQTEPVFRRMMEGVRNARRDAPRFPELEKLRSHVDAADALIVQLEAYYGVYE